MKCVLELAKKGKEKVNPNPYMIKTIYRII